MSRKGMGAGRDLQSAYRIMPSAQSLKKKEEEELRICESFFLVSGIRRFADDTQKESGSKSGLISGCFRVMFLTNQGIHVLDFVYNPHQYDDIDPPPIHRPHPILVDSYGSRRR